MASKEVIGAQKAMDKMDKEIRPTIEKMIKLETKEFEMSNHISKVEDYADAKLIEEMMDMDIEEYTRLRKQKREEDRKKKGEAVKENKKKEEEEGDKKKGEAIKLCLIDKDESTESEDDKSEDSEFLENITSEFFEAVKYDVNYFL